MRRPYEVGNLVRFFYQKFLAIIVGRNEAAPDPLPNIHLSRAHSDVYIIGGVVNYTPLRPTTSGSPQGVTPTRRFLGRGRPLCLS